MGSKNAGPTRPVKETTVYVCQGCYELIILKPGGRSYRHPDGSHTHLDDSCVNKRSNRS